MKFIIFFGITLHVISVSDACFPIRFREQIHPFLPASLQILHHYRDQLVKYYPIAFSSYCRRPSSANRTGYFDEGTTENITGLLKEKATLNIPKGADICVYPTDYRIFRLLTDLHREAENKNINEFQGFPYRILIQLEKTSKMTSAQQLYFILDKLLDYRNVAILSNDIKCKIIQFMDDLKNPTSKLYKNLLVVEPLNYVTWK